MKGKPHLLPSGEKRYQQIGGIHYVATRWFLRQNDATVLANKWRKRGYSARVVSTTPNGYIVWTEDVSKLRSSRKISRLKISIAERIIELAPRKPVLSSGQTLTPNLLAASHSLPELRKTLKEMKEKRI